MVELRYAMICASNVNRSVAAHDLIKQHGMNVESFGVGNHIKLPGPSPSQPNSYAFGSVTYKEIYEDLKQKDEKLYTHNGLLSMMQKDMKVKERPQRWQDRTADDGVFDVVVTFEKRVMDIVVQNLQQGENGMEPCMVINIDVTDSAKEAALAAPHALRLCQLIEQSEDWEADIDEILEKFSQETGRALPQYDVCFQ